MKTIIIAASLALYACGGTIAPCDPPDAAELPDVVSEPDAALLDVAEELDAPPDVDDAGAVVCDFPTGVITCGAGFFYCIVPADLEQRPCDADGGCSKGWACAPTDFDAAIGVCK